MAVYNRILLLIPLILMLINPLQSTVCSRSIVENKISMSVQEIIPQDDAFHGTHHRPTIEWWYFDAVFDEDYGIHIGIKVISMGQWAIVRKIINVYNKTTVERHASSIEPIQLFVFSEKYPTIKQDQQLILSFDMAAYNQSKDWNYIINLSVENIRVNLSFMGITQGFKYETRQEGWTVAQPKASVSGTIQINDQTTSVLGYGYHDHNWNFSLSTGIRAKGWYWGKVTSPQYTITWADIMKTRFVQTPLIDNFAVVNSIHAGFQHIPPEKMLFTVSTYKFINGRFIPTAFHLEIDYEDIEINVTMNAVSIQRTKPRFLTLHYWRYFVTINGYITVGGQTDRLSDDLQIIEFMRFI